MLSENQLRERIEELEAERDRVAANAHDWKDVAQADAKRAVKMQAVVDAVREDLDFEDKHDERADRTGVRDALAALDAEEVE